MALRVASRVASKSTKEKVTLWLLLVHVLLPTFVALMSARANLPANDHQAGGKGNRVGNIVRMTLVRLLTALSSA